MHVNTYPHSVASEALACRLGGTLVTHARYSREALHELASRLRVARGHSRHYTRAVPYVIPRVHNMYREESVQLVIYRIAGKFGRGIIWWIYSCIVLARKSLVNGSIQPLGSNCHRRWMVLVWQITRHSLNSPNFFRQTFPLYSVMYIASSSNTSFEYIDRCQ